jgi:hypothetical protein
MNKEYQPDDAGVAGAKRWLVPAVAYFAVVFAVGFVLGTLRVLLVAPRLGEMAAVAVELPVILASAWLICRWVMRRWAVPSDSRSRLLVGATALVLLLAAEIVLGLTLFGRELAGQLTEMTGGIGAVGLAAQIIYAFFPLMQRRTR